MDLNQTQDIDGFGEGTVLDIIELRKALNVGYSNPPTGNDALRVESLEASLKLLSYGAQHIKLWNDIIKLDEFSTVAEFNQLSAYGSEGGGFTAAGELPEEEDSTYARQTAKVKYVGTTRAVAHPTTLLKTLPANAIAQETNNGILWMLRKIERSLAFGDSAVVPLEWDGLMPQIIAGGGNVIDMRGGVLTDAKLEEVSDVVLQNYGVMTKVYAATTVFSDFSRAYYDKQRFNTPGANPSGKVGTPVKGMTTQAGDLEFVGDVFFARGAAPLAAASNVKAPAAPTIVLANLGATVGSLFAAADAGTYKWQVSGLNSYGESAPSAISGGTALAAGEAASVTITDGGGVYQATGYKLYRTDKGGSTTTFMVQAARTAVAGVYQPTTVVNDLNFDLPGTFKALGLDLTDQSLAFKQLSPLIKMPLAIVSPAIRWMQLLYGTPVVYAPKKNVVFKNIGKL